jgi:hypothetical protein
MTPVESKVTYPAAAGVAVTALYAAASRYHWFTPPPPDVTVPVLTAVWAFVGYWAPHTHRDPPVSPALAHDIAEALAAVERGEAEPLVLPSVQAGGTSTGPAKEGTP